MTPLLCLLMLAPCADDGLEKELGPLMLLTQTPSPESCQIGDHYYPQPGDIVLFSRTNLAVQFCFQASLLGSTTHVAMVVARPDGRPALLETAEMGSRVGLNDVREHIRRFPGPVFVRRIRCPLTAEQSAKLTAFACAQEGKPYDFMGYFTLPIRVPVNFLSQHCLSPGQLNRSRWFCSSLVAAAGVVAGKIDPCVVLPKFTCPNDLSSDFFLDLSANWEKPLRCIY